MGKTRVYGGSAIGGPLDGKKIAVDAKNRQIEIYQPRYITRDGEDIEVKPTYGEYVWNAKHQIWNWKVN